MEVTKKMKMKLSSLGDEKIGQAETIYVQLIKGLLSPTKFQLKRFMTVENCLKDYYCLTRELLL